jgi:hypothetical protein
LLEEFDMNLSPSKREHFGPEMIAAPGPVPTTMSMPAGRRSEAAADEHPAMLQTYRRAGGLVSWDRAVLLLGRHCEQPIARLARWIVARQVVSLVWHSQALVPLFQFELSDMSRRPGVSEVVAELAGAFDGQELAEWFARPNCWLRDAAPVEVIATQQAAVLQAARADRYIAKG